MKWLITGGCGFIGTNLVSRLLEDDENTIVVLDNLSVGTRDDLSVVGDFEELSSESHAANQKQRVALIEADIMSESALLSAAADVDVIVHLAANTGVGPSVENPRQDCLTNVIGTLNVLEAARVSNSRVVFASSGAPIGECEPPIHEELPAHPVSPYGASKLAGEGYCSAYFRSFGVETVALRFGNVYGQRSRHKSSVVAKFIGHALASETLEVYGDGGQTRDFIYVDDLIDAVLMAADSKNAPGEVFQIATDRETTVNELVEILRKAIATQRPELELHTENSDARIGDVRRNFSDTSKAMQLLGWQAKHSLAEGLDATLRWFLESTTRR